MSRNFNTSLAAAAVLGLAGSAFGQAVLSVSQPEINSLEGVATTSVVKVDIPVGLNGAGTFLNGAVTFSAQFFTAAADGTITPVGAAVTFAAGEVDGDNDSVNGAFDAEAFTYADAAATIGLDVGSNVAFTNTFSFTVSTAANNGQKAGVRFIASSAGGGTANPIDTNDPMSVTNGEFDTAAESPELVTGFAINNAFLSNSGGNDTVVIEFSQPLNVGAAANDVNQTISADPGTSPIDVLMGGGAGQVVNNDTIAVSVMGDFTDTANLAVSTPDTAELRGSMNNFLTIVDAEADIAAAIGNAVRVANATDIFSIYGQSLTVDGAPVANTVDNYGVLAAPATFALSSATAVARVDADNDDNDAAAAAVIGAIRMTFTNPILVVPSEDALTLTLAGAATTLAVLEDGDGGQADFDNITVDPSDSNSILVPFQSVEDGMVGDDTVGLGIAADGREVNSFGADSGIFNVTVGDGSFDVTDIFGTAITSTQTAVDVADGIAPSQNGSTAAAPTPANAAFFVDSDGDGALDGVGIITDEPVVAPNATGATVAKVAGAVNPFDQIMADGTLVADAVVAAAMAVDDEITVSSVTVSSTDVGGTSAIEAREMNNTVTFNFDPTMVDWDEDGMVGAADTDGEATPGTGDASRLSLAFDLAMTTIADTAGNTFDNGGGAFGATNAAVDNAAPIFISALHNDSENVSDGANFAGMSNLQCFSETTDDGNIVAAAANTLEVGDVGQNRTDRGIFIFSEAMGAPVTPNNISVNNVFVTDTPVVGGNTFVTFTNANVITIIDEAFDGAQGMTFNLGENAGVVDASAEANPATATGTLADGTDPYLPLALDVNGNAGFSAFSIDGSDAGSAGAGFADSFLFFMNDAIATTLLDDAAEQTARAADFTFAAFAGTTPTSLIQDADNGNILTLSVPDTTISTANAVSITYNGATAATLLTGDAKNDTFSAAVPAEPNVDTESPNVMAITGSLTMGGQAVPTGTQICAYIAVPTVRSAVATKKGLTFRYDRGDIQQGEGVGDGVDLDAITGGVQDSDNITRSLESLTNWLLGIEERVYLLCNSTNLDLYSNTKNALAINGTALAGSFDVIDLGFAATNLNSITFTGTSDDGSVQSGSLRLCYDVLRSRSGTFDSLFEDGYNMTGTPIVSKAVVTGTDGSYALYVSLPNLEASDSDDGLSSDPNVFATQSLPLIIVARTPDGQVFPLSSLVNNINGGGPILFSSEILSQTGTEATGATTLNAELDNVGFTNAFTGYNLVPHSRASGFAETAAGLPVLPDGVVSDDVQVGDSLLSSAGPEDQFVWWVDADLDGVFDGTEINSIVIDNNCINGFPFSLNSRGVQFGTGGLTNIVGGYSFGFGNFNGAALGIAQFGSPLSETGLFTTNAYPNNTTTRGWATVTVTSDFATMDAFFTANPRVDYVIDFDRTANGVATVNSAAPAGGPTSANDLTSLSSGDTVIVHFTNN